MERVKCSDCKRILIPESEDFEEEEKIVWKLCPKCYEKGKYIFEEENK